MSRYDLTFAYSRETLLPYIPTNPLENVHEEQVRVKTETKKLLSTQAAFLSVVTSLLVLLTTGPS